MKITDVTVTLFTWSAEAGSRLPGGPDHPRSGDLGLVEILTDEGVTGRSFLGSLDLPASFDADRVVRWLKPVVVGEDPFDRERLYRRMHAQVRYAGYRALGSMDVALWDLAGKALDQPIHRLLGTARTSIPAYVSSQRLDDPDACADQAVEVIESGWAGFKVHPPRVPARDLVFAERVRQAVGDQAALILDGGWAYTYAEALRVGRRLDELAYLWFEDPLREHDVYSYAKLREKLMIPLLATEQPAEGLESYGVWITARATDMLRGDVPTKGGITAMLKGAHLAEVFGMTYEIHYSGNALCDMANVHVAMAIDNCTYLESLYPDPLHHVGAVAGMSVDEAGLVHAPTDPGLGLEIDHERIRRTTTAVLS